MEGVVLLVIVGVVFLLATLAHAANSGRDDEAARLRREREEADAAKRATAAWVELKEIFPYLPTPRIDDPTAERIWSEIGHALAKQPSIGKIIDSPSARYTDLAGIPVPSLPEEERRRHLYVVGKTGSGKSTFLEHLIVRDLEEGRGVAVMSPEGEFFRERLLPLLSSSRADDLIYFAPGHPDNPLTFNPMALEPGQDAVRAAEDLFTIFRRALSDDDLGPRMQPMLHNAFSALVGRPSATLWDVKRLLEDPAFRSEVAGSCADEYVRGFWLETYPRYPKGADIPIINRLDQFLRPPAMRQALCQAESSFSLMRVLKESRVFFVDLFGLSEDNRLLIGQMLLSKIQLELMRRERHGGQHRPFYIYADEFQSFAGVSETTWRDLLSRGRKYGLCLTLAHQFPAQLPTGLQEEILGNVNSIVAFALGSKDAQVVRRELLRRVVVDEGDKVEPIPETALLELRQGEAYAKYAGGRAVRIATPEPQSFSWPGATRSDAGVNSWRRIVNRQRRDVARDDGAEGPRDFLE